MDRTAHIRLTILLYSLLFLGLAAVLAYNPGNRLILGSLYGLLLVLVTFSHLRYYAPGIVHPNGRWFLIAELLLTYTIAWFDRSTLDQLYIQAILGDAILAYGFGFSGALCGATYLVYPLLIYTAVQPPDLSALWLVINRDIYLMVFVQSVVCLLKVQMDQRARIAQREKESRAQREELDAAYRKLQAYSEEIEEATRLRERNRISSELHDSLGYILTTALLELQAEKMRLEQTTGEKMRSLTLVENQLRKGTKLIRAVVRNRREEFKLMPFRESLEVLIKETRKLSGIRIDLVDDGRFVIDKKTGKMLYDAIMESITNAIRHGQCHRIEIRMACRGNIFSVTINDDGCGFDTYRPGYGTAKIHTRVTSAGGRYRIVSDHGCRVQIDIPVDAEQKPNGEGYAQKHEINA